MEAIAKLTVAGITEGKHYRVLGVHGGFIRIQLDDDSVALRHIKAFNLVVA